MSGYKVTLQHPVQWASEEVAELVLRPTARFYRDVEVTVHSNGSMTYKPYALALAGVKLSGRPAAEKFLDLMHPADMQEVAGVALGFLGGDPTTGNEPSES